MVQYILKRIGYMALVLAVVVTITFFLVHSVPGDPVSAMVQDLPEETREIYLAKYGFDQPLHMQYVKFVRQLLSGDLGQSLRYPGRRVVDIVRRYAPASAVIGGLSLLIGFVTGTTLGVFAALNRNKWSDKVVMGIAIVGTTVPTFTTAALMQYLFTVVWKVFPTTGWGSTRHLVLPVACMCVGPIATYARYMRSSVLDVVNQDYILTAEAKGLSGSAVIVRHILRNAILPCITMLVVSVAGIFSGSFIIESIFAIPGLGKYFISAINDRDYSMVLGLNVIFTSTYIFSVLVSDILSGVLDPRIRIGRSTE